VGSAVSRRPSAFKMWAQVLPERNSADEKPLRQEQVETPTPEANEIRIRIAAYGVCHTDLRVVEGDIHPTRK
jgi:D-arabinose 1-dehydrogenase-like Zn-dependent alcohol dehydrogenase